MPPWGSNPLEPVLQTVAAFSRRLLIAPDAAPDDHRLRPLLSLSLSPPPTPPPPPQEVRKKDAKAGPLTREEVGRATWMLLHTIAAQFPDEPTRQQKRDAKELMAIISRLYPCKECAGHFKEVLKANPVQAGSQAEFSQWLCYVHNVVNRSLGKPIFPCQRVNARWGEMEMKMKRLPLLVLLVSAFVGGNMSLGITLSTRSTVKSSDQVYEGIGLNGRRLQEKRLCFTNRKRRALENVRIDDYQPVDPSPSSKASIGAGPIEHGTPLLPYVPRVTPPPGHPEDSTPAQSPVT
ncbi:hypothetical protein GUJ93_ZPchr0006g45023 [Zizania palustris]|uniref:FAD-linked sulfhydryl oxidase ERV1 n=1 Tax=Zizania palustris TaxID=103762 RepID=A0A8J5SJQ0_ZIZPA|nr:hypothetical protein GUJ93_ZPchr0006g45523 [Zizania palustris]KAG8073950.1 hypothetical protein GUJ93_ZPchr0006g45023 [Zizania palustris]